MKSDSYFELQRAGAFLIDMVIVFLIAFLFFPISDWTNTHWQLSILSLGILQASYFLLFLGPLSLSSQTPGQRLFNQKLISLTNQNLTWKQVLPRGLMMFMILIFELPLYSLISNSILLRIFFEVLTAAFFFNLFWVILDPYGRSLIDFFTGSIVIGADRARPLFVDGNLPKVKFKVGLSVVLIIIYLLFLRSSLLASSQTVYFFQPPTAFSNFDELRTQGIIYRNDLESGQKDSAVKKSILYACGFKFLGLLPVKVTALFSIETGGNKK